MTDCMDCPPGEYCEGLGNTLTDGLCDPGFYCGGKSYQIRPFDTGNLVSVNGTNRLVLPLHKQYQFYYTWCTFWKLITLQ